MSVNERNHPSTVLKIGYRRHAKKLMVRALRSRSFSYKSLRTPPVLQQYEINYTEMEAGA